jgi:hypothetical protein
LLLDWANQILVLLDDLNPSPESLYLSNSVVEFTLASAFHQINYVINHWFGMMTGNQANLASPPFFKVQSFIAFAYTYHYLNWFSKTSIIKWN